jgi:hypothetical protein
MLSRNIYADEQIGVLPPVALTIDKKLGVASAYFASVDAVLFGVLQMTATFQINISSINGSAHFMYIRGPPSAAIGRMSSINVNGQSETTVTIQITMHYHYRGYRSSPFVINKNEMINLGYTIEASGALRVFYNGTLVGEGGVFYEQNLPLAPFERVVDDFNIITNTSCLLGDVAYYKVQKSDAFMENIELYNIYPKDTDLLFGWKQGTLRDIVYNIPIGIV